MPSFHFYLIKTGGHVDSPPAVRELLDDHSAIREAQELCKGGNDVEVWLGGRLVAYVIPDTNGPFLTSTSISDSGPEL